MIVTYRIHGLTVRSDLPLDAETWPASSDVLADIVVERGGTIRVSNETPPGQVIADGVTSRGRFYIATSTNKGIVMRYPGLCEFVIGSDLSSIRWHLDPASNEEFASILISGTVLALVLILRHELVLHASAVEVDGHAIAVVGAPGMGKSTLAALIALGRGSLITDDVLRVEFLDADVVCHPAAREVRLRVSFADLNGGASALVRTTADGRTALHLGADHGNAVPLRSIVIPYPDPERRELLAERAPLQMAHFLLSRYPRVLGWQEPVTRRVQFQRTADLVERVPVYRVRIPWGPPFAPELVDQILGGVGWPVGATSR